MVETCGVVEGWWRHVDDWKDGGNMWRGGRMVETCGGVEGW